MSAPVTSGPELPPVTSDYSIVIARAVEQTDPIPIDCGSEFCTSWFLGSFDQAKTLAGETLSAEFKARIEMGSPFNMQYRQLLLVAREANGTLRVRSVSGFHTLTNEGCLDAGATAALAPEPSGPDLFRQGRVICTIDR